MLYEYGSSRYTHSCKMSKTVSVVAAGAAASLQQFAASVISKVGATAATASSADAVNAVIVGSEAPRGVHTSVTKGATDTIYAGVKTTIVRAILPRGADDSLQLRDAVDILPSSGINADSEFDAAVASYKKSAAIAVEAAKAQKASKISIVLKQQTKFAENNRVFQQAAKEVVEAAGIHCEVLTTAAATNALLLFPETLSVVLTNDTPAADNIEQAFAGVTGSSRVFYTDKNTQVPAGHSTKTVATAVAETLKGLGLATEAKKIESAVAKAKSSKDILASL